MDIEGQINGGNNMKQLFFIIAFLILMKYIIIMFGYIGCHMVTKNFNKKYIAQNSNNKNGSESVNNKKVSNSKPEKKSFFIKVKTYGRRLIDGYLRYSIIFTGKLPSHTLRNFIYQYIYYLDLGKNAVLYGGSEIRDAYKIKIGSGTIIGDNSILDGRNGLTIGKNVNLSTGVWIWTEQHNPQSPYFSSNGARAPVVIGDRAWLSCRTIILPGVNIGEGAIIAAGAVVTKNVEPFSIYAGIPARKIGQRNKNLLYEFDGKCMPFY